jgi:hypothetical protein
MQFLESVAQKLNTVDRLAAEVAVVAAKEKVDAVRHRAADNEKGEGDLELYPEAIESADAVEALASRLGFVVDGEGEEGEGEGEREGEGEGGNGDLDPARSGGLGGGVVVAGSSQSLMGFPWFSVVVVIQP